MNKEIKDFTDLELSEILGQNYQELMRVQSNLLALNQEIQKRKLIEKPKEELKKEK